MTVDREQGAGPADANNGPLVPVQVTVDREQGRPTQKTDPMDGLGLKDVFTSAGPAPDRRTLLAVSLIQTQLKLTLPFTKFIHRTYGS